MIADASDDTDSFAAIVSCLDALLFCYGADEDEIGDHLEDHKREKTHRENKLVRGKKHLAGVHLERITLQWETQVTPHFSLPSSAPTLLSSYRCG